MSSSSNFHDLRDVHIASLHLLYFQSAITHSRNVSIVSTLLCERHVSHRGSNMDIYDPRGLQVKLVVLGIEKERVRFPFRSVMTTLFRTFGGLTSPGRVAGSSNLSSNPARDFAAAFIFLLKFVFSSFSDRKIT